jgi:hypothetical protein
MLSPIHIHIHITLLYSAYEAIVKSIPNKTPGDGGKNEEKAYATQHYVKSILC